MVNGWKYSKASPFNCKLFIIYWKLPRGNNRLDRWCNEIRFCLSAGSNGEHEKLHNKNRRQKRGEEWVNKPIQSHKLICTTPCISLSLPLSQINAASANEEQKSTPPPASQVLLSNNTITQTTKDQQPQVFIFLIIFFPLTFWILWWCLFLGCWLIILCALV